MRGETETQHAAAPDHFRPAEVLHPSGDVIDKKYRVERTLGKGGMGTVLLVVHEHLGTRHAMKLLLGDAWKDETWKKRFLAEAQTAAALRSRHAVKVSDFGFLPMGAPYMVMEHLDGKDLRDVLDEGGPLSPSDVACFLIQACDALAEAHARGIVHRDLKPSNLFLTRDENGRPCIKVLDFGIAKVPQQAAGSDRVSTTAGFFGTAPYVSPEQIRSTKDVDARADIWSLGVTAYELLTGALPFEAESPLQTFAKILEEEPLHPAQRRSDLPHELAEAVMACLIKRREDRTPDAAALARAMVPFAPGGTGDLIERMETRLAGKGNEGAERADEGVQGEAAAPKIQVRAHTDASWSSGTLALLQPKRRVWPWVAAGAAACGIVALWLGLRTLEAPPPAPPTEAIAPASMAPSMPATRATPDPGTAAAAASPAPAPGEPPIPTVMASSTAAAAASTNPVVRPGRGTVTAAKPKARMPNLPSDDPPAGN